MHVPCLYYNRCKHCLLFYPSLIHKYFSRFRAALLRRQIILNYFPFEDLCRPITSGHKYHNSNYEKCKYIFQNCKLYNFPNDEKRDILF